LSKNIEAEINKSIVSRIYRRFWYNILTKLNFVGTIVFLTGMHNRLT